ncbi:hypothetical protein [Streptomyces sp. NL15-2K]|uniref:hypothetical protein n=1 Tax=Streptomyces sp. NL15-2K TaxID=376149 RepID=UPI000F57BEC5|nr:MULTISPECIES: hypothetical protein [Actinomycetes]WKX15678.1 hypothetical protein Q4V64_52545 [Kutzneria buriramensis]
MALIGNDRRITDAHRQSDGAWRFTVEYTAHFDPSDRGQFFDDSVKIWEHDPGDDDQVTAYAPTERFQAPQDGSPAHRVKQFTATADQLDTEIDDEETYAWIWLRRAGAGPADDEQRTPIRVTAP